MTAPTPSDRRGPPHDLEAEASVLGAILLDRDAITRVLELLVPEDFYRENNGFIYRAAANLFQAGRPIDNVTMAGELESLKALAQVGGRAHLALLQEQVPTAANVEHYALIVRGHSWRRQMIAAAARASALAYDPALEAGEALNAAQAEVFAVGGEQAAGQVSRLYDLLAPTMDRIEAQMANGGGLVGLSTGFHDLDRLTGGLKDSNLTIVAGRPSMGKSSLATNVMRFLSVVHRVPVLIFSLEMSRDELVERLLCEEARVDAQRMHRGLLSDVEYERVTSALGPLGEAPFYIDDTPALDDLTLRLRARQAKARYDIGVIVIDYLQLMSGRHKEGGDVNRVQEVSAISRSLKSIARELRIPVVALSQLSRAPESRPDKRPILSDLRESGSIEQDADVVWLMFRDEYYNREKSEKPGVAEVIVAKNRSGPTGVVELMFRKELTRFENLERARPGPLGDD